MDVGGSLQLSGEEPGSVSGIELRDRAKASESDVQRAASLLKQAQRYCPHFITSMHPEQHLPACACWSLSKICLGSKALRSHAEVISCLVVERLQEQCTSCGLMLQAAGGDWEGSSVLAGGQGPQGSGGQVWRALPGDRHGPRGRPGHACGLRQRGALARAGPH